MDFTSEQIQEYLDYAIKLGLDYAPKLVLALITFAVGWFVVGRINQLIRQLFKRSKLDKSVEGFLESLLNISLKVILIIIVASMLGVQTTSLVALLGAAGLAIGLALQGSLSNFAGGVLILTFKPFKVGDYIQAQGQEGTVEQIQIFNTTLKTVDNKNVVIPNGNLSNDAIVNFTANRTRRVDLIFGVSYDDDLKKAKEVIAKIIAKEKRILETPESLIAIGNLGDSSVDIFCRVWVKTPDYWPVKFDLLETVKIEFDKVGISIPYPQQDVHHYQHNAPKS